MNDVIEKQDASEVVTNETIETEQKEQKEQTPSYTDAVNELRQQFEKRVSDMQADFNAKLHEREMLINQLLNEEKTDTIDTNSDLISRIDERRKRSKF